MSRRATVVLPGSSRSGENATKNSFPVRTLVARGFETGAVFFFEDRDHHFFGGAGIGRALEHDQLPGAQMRSDGVSGVGDEAEVGFVIFVQRSGDADDNGVHGGDLRIVGGGGKAMRLGGLDFFGRDAIDVGAALGQGFDLAGVDVEAGDLEFLFAVQQASGSPT